MSETELSPGNNKLRLLVVIAGYGEKNIELLKRMIRAYQSLSLAVDVVVVSNAPKDLGPNVRVVVGLPTTDPWSLPFAHKAILAENADRYDLFAYGEDDMRITDENIQAFLRATPQLASNEIAGFLRYEIGPTGAWSMPDVFGPYHWKAESVKRRGDYTVAEFTNEHAAFYLLTRSQLKKAVASCGFLREPNQGRYDLACTAATDPYTSCGFRKVICVSHLKDFLIHHASNRYVGRMGTPLAVFEEQLKTLKSIADGAHPATTLCATTESGLLHGRWSKSYYEKTSDELLEMTHADAKKILSVGCGWGITEAALQGRGAKVTAVALDSVIGAEAAKLGIDVIYGTLAESFRGLDGKTFDCVLMTDLLHLLPNPKQTLRQCAQLVGTGGTLVLGGPNFDSLRLLAKRALGTGDYRKLRAFEHGGINVLGPGTVTGCLKDSGFRVEAVRWLGPGKGPLRRLKAESWVLRARR
ncbi:MAG TPA: methyltransferase domain-containing protein [Verrucomicrobiae bacterium]|nr:methyltransferase domain-containing protein [Verrucomicrobiae bacterium]